MENLSKILTKYNMLLVGRRAGANERQDILGDRLVPAIQNMTHRGR